MYTYHLIIEHFDEEIKNKHKTVKIVCTSIQKAL